MLAVSALDFAARKQRNAQMCRSGDRYFHPLKALISKQQSVWAHFLGGQHSAFWNRPPCCAWSTYEKSFVFSLSNKFSKSNPLRGTTAKAKKARKLANRYQECFTKFCNDCFGEKRKKLNFSGQKMADSVSCATFAFFCDKNQIVPKSSANPQTRTAKSASATSENLSTMRVPPWCREEVVFCSCAVMGSTSSRFGAWQIISHLFLVIPAGETSKSKSGAFDFVPASSMHVCPIFFNGVLTLKVNRLRAFKGLAPPCSLFWGKYVDGIMFPFSDRESTALFPVVFSSMGKQLWPYELSAQE